MQKTRNELTGKALQVLQAAQRIFFVHGFSAATTDMIQQEAGVSKSTVYSHFPNKEQLFAAVIAYECENFTNIIRNISFSSGTLRDTLFTVARAYLDIVLSQKGLAIFRVVVSEAPRFPELADTLYNSGTKVIYEKVEKIFAKAEQAGELDLSDLSKEVLASQFMSLARSGPQLQCLLYPSNEPTVEQKDIWANEAVTTFIRAYGCPT